MLVLLARLAGTIHQSNVDFSLFERGRLLVQSSRSSLTVIYAHTFLMLIAQPGDQLSRHGGENLHTRLLGRNCS